MKKEKRNRVSEENSNLDDINLFARKRIESIMGRGKVISEIYQIVEDYADQDCPILIQGETGVGKKEIATYLHSISSRKDQKMITVDLTTIPENLIETELFGCKKGAYTDAKEDRKGKIEIANGGTLFLDEINSLPIQFQRKLLRLIQEKEITRVGDTKPIKVDVRIIAAGNEDFADLVQNKRFRLDLIERFVEVIRIPTLEERKEDMDFFIEKFIEKKANELGKKGVHIHKKAREMLKNHQWVGNVRGLMNFIHKLITRVKQENGAKNYMITTELLTKYNLYENLTNKKQTNDNKDFTWRTAQNIARKNAMELALQKANGNHEEAITLLGISRRTYYAWKKELM